MFTFLEQPNLIERVAKLWPTGHWSYPAPVARKVEASTEGMDVIEWLFRLGYPFDLSWPSNPPPVDHRKLAKVWNQRDNWGIDDEEAYLLVCDAARIEPDQVADAEGRK